MSKGYRFSIEDFHNKSEIAKKYLITEYGINLLIVATSSVNDAVSPPKNPTDLK